MVRIDLRSSLVEQNVPKEPLRAFSASAIVGFAPATGYLGLPGVMKILLFDRFPTTSRLVTEVR